MSRRDFYQALGVPRNASSTDIRIAFVRLAKHHHPDHARNAGELPGRLHEVQQAYRCLSDVDARAEHDRTLNECERLHVARQRSVQRRLQRYDKRHPHPHPRSQFDTPTGRDRKNRWRSLLVVTAGVVIVVRALNLIG
jgi:DnaJ-class molecular chaperone